MKIIMEDSGQDIEMVKSLIANTKHCNNGHGLIVNWMLADRLLAHGIKEGYTIDKPMKIPYCPLV